MNRPEFAYFHHPACALHDMGAGHPEQPKRVIAVHEALKKSGLLEAQNTAPLVTREQLLRVHEAHYLDALEDADAVLQSGQEEELQLDPDTSINRHSIEAAKRAAGAGVAAVEWVLASSATRRAFCNVRPPGHHAEPGYAKGFCILHSTAVAVAHALSLGLKRVALVDFDVHHGNGSETMFAGHEKVRFYSSFQYPYYPHSGVPSKASNIVNAPLAWGSGSEEIKAVFERDFLPDLARFAPELIVISAGFDAHKDDPLAGLNFATEDYAWMTEKLIGIQGRVVSMLEGGYSLDALAQSAVAHVKALKAA